MNTFGYGSQRLPLYDVRSVLLDRQRFRREAVPLLERANSFYMPSGKYPCRGWILLARHDYNQLDKYFTDYQLEISDTSLADNVGTLNGLSIVQAQCVTRGLASDLNALYLVEITDARGLLHNQWFQQPVTTSYNVRSPAYPQDYYEDTLSNGTDAWTWATMLQSLWNQMGLLGAWPGLPSVPAGVPEGFWFPGVGIWESFNHILDNLGMTVACNLASATPYTIVSQNADDATLTELQTRYQTHLEDDLEWIDYGAGRVPASVKVLFRRRNSIYGSEETVRRDTLQWSTSAVYSVSVNAPEAYSGGTGIHYLWSDFTVRYDQDNNPLAADVTTAAAIAAERVTQYYARISPSAYMSQGYAGALPFATGSKVDGVCWYQDGRSSNWQGWRTRLIYGPSPPFPEVG